MPKEIKENQLMYNLHLFKDKDSLGAGNLKNVDYIIYYLSLVTLPYSLFHYSDTVI